MMMHQIREESFVDFNSINYLIVKPQCLLPSLLSFPINGGW